MAPRILVVDDEPSIRELLVRALESVGYEVVAVRDGKAGLEAAKTAKTAYDLVVTNSCMPHLTGEQLIGQLRALYPNFPILHLDDLARPLGPHAAEVPQLYKPFSIDALLQAVAQVLEDRHHSRDPAELGGSGPKERTLP